ncbi:hypothetical protein LG3211_4448 [Lysobacter gummosus]|nr:hypothetical protein LG3211_4448 [Lysobacter gummosus]
MPDIARCHGHGPPWSQTTARTARSLSASRSGCCAWGCSTVRQERTNRAPKTCSHSEVPVRSVTVPRFSLLGECRHAACAAAYGWRRGASSQARHNDGRASAAQRLRRRIEHAPCGCFEFVSC